MDAERELAALERLIGRTLPAPLREAVRMAAGTDSVMNEDEPGELRLFGVGWLRQEYLSFRQGWGGESEGILPFGTVLMGSCRLGVDRRGRVLDLTPLSGGSPGWAVVAPDVATFFEQLEQRGLYWLNG